ncbi:hypothetical protein EDB89DRAFT_1911895 [Lactarius sanguifluus]|nr:hypothetical protein EDB89DRAFT_1911895 [Lactarius sanguifluus]
MADHWPPIPPPRRSSCRQNEPGPIRALCDDAVVGCASAQSPSRNKRDEGGGGVNAATAAGQGRPQPQQRQRLGRDDHDYDPKDHKYVDEATDNGDSGSCAATTVTATTSSTTAATKGDSLATPTKRSQPRQRQRWWWRLVGDGPERDEVTATIHPDPTTTTVVALDSTSGSGDGWWGGGDGDGGSGSGGGEGSSGRDGNNSWDGACGGGSGGGSSGVAPRLRDIHLDSTAFPMLPQVFCQPTNLFVFDSMISQIPDTSHPSSSPLVFLPALTDLQFKGDVDYLENLVTKIDAPAPERFTVTLFEQSSFNIPQLSQCIGRTRMLRLPHQTSIELSEAEIVVTYVFDSRHVRPRQMATLVHISRQLSTSLASPEWLDVAASSDLFVCRDLGDADAVDS